MSEQATRHSEENELNIQKRELVYAVREELDVLQGDSLNIAPTLAKVEICERAIIGLMQLSPSEHWSTRNLRRQFTSLWWESPSLHDAHYGELIALSTWRLANRGELVLNDERSAWVVNPSKSKTHN